MGRRREERCRSEGGRKRSEGVLEKSEREVEVGRRGERTMLGSSGSGAGRSGATGEVCEKESRMGRETVSGHQGWREDPTRDRVRRCCSNLLLFVVFHGCERGRKSVEGFDVRDKGGRTCHLRPRSALYRRKGRDESENALGKKNEKKLTFVLVQIVLV